MLLLWEREQNWWSMNGRAVLDSVVLSVFGAVVLAFVVFAWPIECPSEPRPRYYSPESDTTWYVMRYNRMPTDSQLAIAVAKRKAGTLSVFLPLPDSVRTLPYRQRILWRESHSSRDTHWTNR